VVTNIFASGNFFYKYASEFDQLHAQFYLKRLLIFKYLSKQIEKILDFCSPYIKVQFKEKAGCLLCFSLVVYFVVLFCRSAFFFCFWLSVFLCYFSLIFFLSELAFLTSYGFSFAGETELFSIFKLHEADFQQYEFIW